MRKIITLFLFSTAQLLAQTAPSPNLVAESLLIGPGDLLHIQFYDTPELEQHPRVDDSGAAQLLFLGPVILASKTPAQAATFIATLMIAGHFMSHPQVVVSIDQYATQEVTVSGEVARPGNYAIATPRSVLDVLSMAGGLSPIADRHIVILHRGAIAETTTYFVSNDPAIQLAADVRICPGDTILVAKAGIVYILGDVGRPGGYPLVTNEGRESLLQAIAIAGSANKTAVLSQVRLLHKTSTGYTEVKIDFDKVQKGKAPDIELAADDVLFVPFSYAKSFALNSTGIAASVGSAVIYTH